MQKDITPDRLIHIKIVSAAAGIFFCCVCCAEIKPYEIDTSGFCESTETWYEYNGKDDLVRPEPNQPCYKLSQIKEIADNILLYQKTNGGWPENYDMTAILTEKQKEKIIRAKNTDDTTFDNGTTYPQIEYLAKAYQIIKDEKYKEAALRGIDFTLSAQYANGGWPQFFPLRKDYSRHITFNDDAETGVMAMLKDIVEDKPYYSFIEKGRREKIKIAYDKGLDCILKCQINDNGKLTAWCQQHDEKNLRPVGGRTYELPSICGEESANVVLFLMSIDKPGKEVINSVQAAVKWFEESKIIGIRVEKINAPEVKYSFGVSKKDRVVVKDANASPIWARFYELKTERPLFADRRGVAVYSLAEVNRERRCDYSFYTHEPQKVLNKYPAWEKK
jgi:PelA/Pel-15E family pectate lyase